MSFLTYLEKTIDIYFAMRPRQRPSIQTEPKLIAHRGAHDKYLNIIENTKKAFDHALALDCYGIEFDVHATQDNILVVNHDPTLTRLWGHNKAIKDLSFAELRSLVPQIPSLDEVVLDFGKKMHLFIELKAPFKAEQELKKTLAPLIAGEDYHLLSLDEPLFADFSLFPAEILLLVAIHNNVSLFCKAALEKDYGGVLGHYLLFDNKLIRQMQLVGKKMGLGFIDSKYSLYRELKRNVEWLFTNKATRMAKYFKTIKP
ncbi:MAG: glycerophosphodiester phosphodiesterase [Proteobacteria bacterium]|nr:glycerophosphodiester phosphodiesterase [Pseudomonadota bacterium]